MQKKLMAKGAKKALAISIGTKPMAKPVPNAKATNALAVLNMAKKQASKLPIKKIPPPPPKVTASLAPV